MIHCYTIQTNEATLANTIQNIHNNPRTKIIKLNIIYLNTTKYLIVVTYKDNKIQLTKELVIAWIKKIAQMKI